jgi:hypothetical protein
MVSFKVYVAIVSRMTANTKILDTGEIQATELIAVGRMGFDSVIVVMWFQ